jgi:hypothetical protein
MISIYLRNGDLAEVNAESVETRSWDMADGSQLNCLVCLDNDGTVAGQFLMDQIAGWMFSLDDDIFDFGDDDDE